MSNDPFRELLNLLLLLEIIDANLADKLYNGGYNKYSY